MKILINNSFNNLINHIQKNKLRRNNKTINKTNNKNLELIRKLKLYQKHNKLNLIFLKLHKSKRLLKNKKKLNFRKAIIHKKIMIKLINILFKIMNPLNLYPFKINQMLKYLIKTFR